MHSSAEKTIWTTKLTPVGRAWKSWQVAKTGAARDAVASIGPRVQALSANAQTMMRESPAKWTAIATGAGLAVGLLLRLLHRRTHRRRMPSIVIIEAAR